MRVLAIDTSTLQGSVGWIRTSDAGSFSQLEVSDWAEMNAPAAPGHCETLLHRIESILRAGQLKVQDVDLFVYGRGPGTFTGLRIGLSTIKGLALALGKPLVGISSTEALALSAPVTGFVACLIDARRRELFAGIYRVTRQGGRSSAEPVVPEWVAPATTIMKQISKHQQAGHLYLTGNGIGPYRDLLRQECADNSSTILPEHYWAPSAARMAEAGLQRFLERGGDNLDGALPIYLREPDAKLPGAK